MNWKFRHFTPEEVLSPASLELFTSLGISMVRFEALELLDSWREDLGVPLVVNSGESRLRGHRTFEENAALPNSARWSQHVQGVAFDVSSPDMSSRELYHQALDFGWTGVGLYQSFVHVDLRNKILPGVISWTD